MKSLFAKTDHNLLKCSKIVQKYIFYFVIMFFVLAISHHCIIELFYLFKTTQLQFD